MRFEVEVRFVRGGQVVERGRATGEVEAGSTDCLDTLLAVLPDVLMEGKEQRKTYTLDLDVLEKDRDEENPWTINETSLVSLA